MKHIFGYADTHNKFDIELLRGLYCLYHNGKQIARFDTEEKARIFSDGLQKGLEWGYATSYKRDTK